jgi:dihydrofolate synthase/folylpolyglutamate synthase
MNFKESLQFLDSHINRSLTREKIDDSALDNMRILAETIGNPQSDFPTIHITGTNGKGSTSALISKLLTSIGLNVGTYCSPHVSSITERIQLNTEPISEEEFSELVQHLKLATSMIDITPSWFELMTAAAFECFANNAVDVAVIEVGMLGRFDATNIADAKVAVITNVGYDHTDGKEGWKERLAWEKAGIIKADTILCLGEIDQEIERVILNEASSKILRREIDFVCTQNDLAVGGRHISTRINDVLYDNIFLSQHGIHQGQNAAIALAGAEAFLGIEIPKQIVEESFADISLPGRFEIISNEPLIILDGAHNPPGALAAAQTFQSSFNASGKRTLIVGMTEEKDADWMLGNLNASAFDSIITTEAPIPRSMSSNQLAAVALDHCSDVVSHPNPEEALLKALTSSSENDIIFGTGSMYVVGALREASLKLQSKQN